MTSLGFLPVFMETCDFKFGRMCAYKVSCPLLVSGTFASSGPGVICVPATDSLPYIIHVVSESIM